jgi:hypothetical protein
MTSFGNLSAAGWEFQLRSSQHPPNLEPTGSHAGIAIDATPPHCPMPGEHFFSWTLLSLFSSLTAGRCTPRCSSPWPAEATDAPGRPRLMAIECSSARSSMEREVKTSRHCVPCIRQQPTGEVQVVGPRCNASRRKCLAPVGSGGPEVRYPGARESSLTRRSRGSPTRRCLRRQPRLLSIAVQCRDLSKEAGKK